MPSDRPTKLSRPLRPGPQATPPAPGECAFELVVMSGPDVGRAFLVDKPQVRLGKAEGNDIVLSDETVSREHCVLELTPKGVCVRDMGSRNGTRVNGVVVMEALLAAGAQLTTGDTTLRLQARARPAPR